MWNFMASAAVSCYENTSKLLSEMTPEERKRFWEWSREFDERMRRHDGCNCRSGGNALWFVLGLACD